MISVVRFGFFFIFLIVCSNISGIAQISGGLSETTSSNMGGNAYISGAVLLPNGSPLNTRIPIILQSQTKGEILATTDDSGKFVFSRISPGLYTFVIQGDTEYETVSQEVEVLQQRNSGAQTYSITIRLRYRPKINAKPGVIRSDNADVPKKALKIYDEALKLVKSKDVDGAIEQLNRAVAEYPAFVNAYNELGIQYMEINDFKKAEESFRQALKIKPDAFEPLMNRGILLFRQKRFSDAEPFLRSALSIKDEALAHFYLGRLLTNLTHYDEAEKEFNLALKLSKNEMTEVYRMLANLYIAMDDCNGAVNALETYLRLMPKAPDAVNLRKVLSQLQDFKPPTKPDIKPE